MTRTGSWSLVVVSVCFWLFLSCFGEKTCFRDFFERTSEKCTNQPYNQSKVYNLKIMLVNFQARPWCLRFLLHLLVTTYRGPILASWRRPFFVLIFARTTTESHNRPVTNRLLMFSSFHWHNARPIRGVCEPKCPEN